MRLEISPLSGSGPGPPSVLRSRVTAAVDENNRACFCAVVDYAGLVTGWAVTFTVFIFLDQTSLLFVGHMYFCFADSVQILAERL